MIDHTSSRNISVNNFTPLDNFWLHFCYSCFTASFANCSLFFLEARGFFLSRKEREELEEESLYLSRMGPSVRGSHQAQSQALMELILMYFVRMRSFHRSCGEIDGSLLHSLTYNRKHSPTESARALFQKPSMVLQLSKIILTGRKRIDSTFKNLKKVSKILLELENGTLQYLLFVFLLQMIQLKIDFLVNTFVFLSSLRVDSLMVWRRRFWILRLLKLLRLPSKSQWPSLSEKITLPHLSTSMTEQTLDLLMLSRKILKSISWTGMQVQEERMGSESQISIGQDEE